MAESVKIILPYIPSGLNINLARHWSETYKENNGVEEDVGWLLRIAFKKPIPKWEKIKISCFGYNNKLDYDNFIGGSCKHIVDSVCYYLGILNDSREFVEREYWEDCKDNGEQRVEIIIERRDI